jgi:hypothetical protein
VRRSSLLLLLALALAAAPAASRAQDGPSEQIDGFAGFPWGTARSELEARLGDPLQAETLETGFTVVAWTAPFADTTVVALYGLVPDEGLVKGQYTLGWSEGDDCVALFRSFRTAFMLRYPLLVPDDRSYNELGSAFCPAVVEGRAGWMTQWDDEETGARARVVIEAGRLRVNAVVESAAFLAWIERTAPPEPGAEAEPDR